MYLIRSARNEADFVLPKLQVDTPGVHGWDTWVLPSLIFIAHNLETGKHEIWGEVQKNTKDG